MADKWAVQDGNWSDPATWNNGTLPGVGDDVYADGKTVTINQDINVLSIRTTQRSGGTAGGGFTINSARTIACTGAGVVAGSTICLTLEAGNYDTTITANVTGGNSNNAYGIYNMSTGSVTITGNVTGGSGSYYAYGIYNMSTGSVTITGNVTGGSGTNHVYGIYNMSTGSVTITGDVTGGSGENSCYGIRNASTGSVTITGNVTGGGGVSSFGIANNSVATVTVNGTNHYGKSSSAFYSTANGTLIVTGDCYADPYPAVYWIGSGSYCEVRGNRYGLYTGAGQGNLAVICYREAIPQSENVIIRGAKAGSQPGTFSGLPAWLYGALVSPQGHPSPANVRYGIQYGPNNEATGTCYVPIAASVAAGVLVDDTEGTAVLTPEAVRAAVGLASANLDTQLDNIPTVSEFNARTIVAENYALEDTLTAIKGAGWSTETLTSIKADTAAILADTGTDGVVVAEESKTGYSLSATGLDLIPATDPGGVADTFPKMMVQLWRRFFKKATKTSSQIKTFADDDTTVRTTQTVSDDGTTETQGAAI